LQFLELNAFEILSVAVNSVTLETFVSAFLVSDTLPECIKYLYLEKSTPDGTGMT